MRILLDSHTFVWFLAGDQRCSLRARRHIEDADAEVFVSAVTAWETAIKVRAGRWSEAEFFASNIEAILIKENFAPLPLTIEHGRVAGFLSGAHRDPFDRMLAAQAIVDDMPLVTADPAFRHFDVRVIW